MQLIILLDDCWTAHCLA